MMKRILVPLDGSPLAEEILSRVRDFAMTQGAQVILLRVAFALVFPGSDPSENQIKVVEEANLYVDEMKRKLEAEGMEAEGVVRYGFPAQEILEHAARNNIDLIAMATHGRSGPTRWVLGSVAEEVLRHSQIPVLLFRASKTADKKYVPGSAFAQPN
ncbi:MAG: universal stress protein [bacterium]|nr:universal stress protein [bacterium]